MILLNEILDGESDVNTREILVRSSSIIKITRRLPGCTITLAFIGDINIKEAFGNVKSYIKNDSDD